MRRLYSKIYKVLPLFMKFYFGCKTIVTQWCCGNKKSKGGRSKLAVENLIT